jgi:predicted Zn finger-like uncharacterized protein
MLTRCPACATAFRITREQLQARHGMVRCGCCGRAFNAVDNAVELPAGEFPAPATNEAPEYPAMAAPPAASPTASPGDAEALAEGIAKTEAFGPEESQAGMPRFVAPSTVERAMAEAPPEPEAASPAVATVGEAASAPGTAPPMTGQAEEPEGHAGTDWASEQRPITELLASATIAEARRRPGLAWGLAVLAMVLLAGAQLAYLFRDEISSGVPWTRPLLGAYCDLFGCSIALLKLPELIDIEYSDLQPESGRRDRLMLRVLVRNRAAVVQAFPHLELTLTDHRDQALARRVLAPADYLPTETDVAAGVPANGEIHVALPLDVAGVGATGYRLYVFYP